MLVLASFLLFSHIPVLATSNQAAPVTETKTQAETENELIAKVLGELSFISQASYLILWPFVALAGLAMDNNLVYWSYLHLDAPLWKVWTIVKNLANFIIWFIFLYEILYYAIGVKRNMSKSKGPWALIKKVLIAGVWVQLSWFIMMVAVDISSVLTYTVGALPTTLLSQTDAKQDMKVVGVGVRSNLWNIEGKGTQDDRALSYYMTLPWKEKGVEKNIAPCKHIAVRVGGKDQQLIVWRSFNSLGTGASLKKMEEGYCFDNGSIYSYKEWNSLSEAEQWNKKLKEKETELKGTDADKKASEMLSNNQAFLLSQKFEKKEWLTNNCDHIWPIPNTPIKTEQKDWSQTSSTSGQKKYYCLYDQWGFSLSDLTQKATGWTGPFVALYGNMISFAKLNDSLGVKQQLISAVINVVFLLAMLLPLIAMVVVLFWRVFLLWLAIALSPLIVLVNVFWDMLSGLKIQFLDDILNLDKLRTLLLAPVFIGFALSMALMFMTILKTSVHTEDTQAAQNAASQGITSLTGMKCGGTGETTCDLLGFIKITFSSAVIDLYSLLIGLFGVGISWILLFWALKQVDASKKLVSGLQDLWEKFVSTTPIIPVNWTNVGLWAFSDIPTTLLNNYSSEFDKRRTVDTNFLLGKEKAKEKKMASDFFLGSNQQYLSILNSTNRNDAQSKEDAKQYIAALYNDVTESTYNKSQKLSKINTSLRSVYFDKKGRNDIHSILDGLVDSTYWEWIVASLNNPALKAQYKERDNKQKEQNKQNSKIN